MLASNHQDERHVPHDAARQRRGRTGTRTQEAGDRAAAPRRRRTTLWTPLAVALTAALSAPLAVRTAHAADLAAAALEVTQGVQSLDNRVALIEGRRTFVRFYATASDGFFLPTARLFVGRPGVPGDTMLLPSNPGGTSPVWAAPTSLGPLGDGRASRDVGFLFELPSAFTSGTIDIAAVVNWNNDTPPETDIANNVLTRTFSFDESVPEPDLTFYLLTYTVGGSTFSTAGSHADQTADWLLRGYPISGLDFVKQTAIWTGSTATAIDPTSGVLNLTTPSCRDLNQAIAVVEGLNLGARRGPVVTRSYGPVRSIGMVSDAGGFMRGCSAGIPGPLASGPTGSGTWGWDFDGSYGDWYASHELAHTYQRFHAEFCDAEGGHRYPYPFGRISAPSPLLGRVFGFDVSTRDVYSHLWKDNMTYCVRQWFSDLTYEGIRRFLQDPTYSSPTRIAAASSGRGMAAADGLAGTAATPPLLSIVGSIDPAAGAAELQPAFAVAAAAQLPPSDPGGTHAIVLRDDAGNELLRQGFTPLEQESGPPYPGTVVAGEVETFLVAQAVALVAGTRQVDLEGPGGVLASLRPGAIPPALAVLAPKGQEVVDGEPVTVAWDAKDLDGDALTFVVQYRSADDAPWRSVALPSTGSSAVIPFENLPSGESARFRVWASDGINTSFADSDPFVVANRPPSLELLSPASGEAFAKGQAVALQARAYDADVGGLDGKRLVWASSRDGLLGHGRQLTVASLSEGSHVIEVRADDGRGKEARTAAAEVQIEVVGDLAKLPQKPDRLIAGPADLLVTPSGRFRRATLLVYEEGGREVRFTAAASAPWVKISRRRGTTPAALQVSVRRKHLARPFGEQEATILVSSPELNAPPVEVRVHLQDVDRGDCKG